MYGMLGASAGRHDMNYGIEKRNGYGGGFGVMAGLTFPFVAIPGGDLAIGAYFGGDVMGGSERTSADPESGIWINFRGEAGFQVNLPLPWQDMRASIRAGGIYLADSAAGGLLGKGLKVRLDRRQFALEVGIASGGASGQSLTFRYRKTFLKCFGVGVERVSVSDRQSDGLMARVFYAVDI